MTEIPYIFFADEYAMKGYIFETIREEYVVSTLGVWKCFDDIDFYELPESFVLKCTFYSGSCIVVKNKHDFDTISAKTVLEKSL